MSYLILAQSKVTASALGALLELLGEEGCGLMDEDRHVVESHFLRHAGGIGAYERTVAWLDAGIERHGNHGLGAPSVLVDTVQPSALSAVVDSMSWDTLLALLILTFPEVRWIFGVVIGTKKDFPEGCHHLPALICQADRNPIFDPTGLRHWVRERTNATLVTEHQRAGKGGHPMQLPLRTMLAAALDDEGDFATIHAYTAYRYGFRADIITSWALMDQQFGETRAKQPGAVHDYHLLLEDMRLAFPDKPGRVHLSDLRDRAVHCELLAADRDRSEWRFLITSGQTGVDDDLVENNEEFLEDKQFGRGQKLLKPIGGVCDLWKRTGLLDEFSANEEDNARGNAPGFHWPPKELDDDSYHGHAAAGKLGMVAATLVRRAKAAKERADGSVDYLLAALLASEAAELLSGKTPDLTLSALQIKHECEVRTECAFIGTGFHFELKQRLKEIKMEVDSVARWSQRSRKKAIDARAAIVKDLRKAYAEAGQMEEEDRCLVEFRKLNRIMNRPDRWWKHVLVVPWISQCILAYGEWLLSSFSWLLTMIVVWIVIAVGWLELAKSFSPLRDPEIDPTFSTEAFSWFFGAGPEEVYSSFEQIVSCGTVMVGVFHIGILMSYLYSLISRK